MKKLALITTILGTFALVACNKVTVDTADTPTDQTPVQTATTVPADTTPGYTLAEVENHNTKLDCRSTVDGTVYDITTAFGKHPGGDEKLQMMCGKDASTSFTNKHGENEKAKNMLQSFIIGDLQ